MDPGAEKRLDVAVAEVPEATLVESIVEALPLE
jgi:hypothetical protein